MNCVVTAGPTYEPLDEVRRLTNFSSGRLGTELANFLTDRGHRVALLLGQQSTWNGERRASSLVTFTTTSDLRDRLHGLADRSIDAVFHAAAVSDFSFGRVWLESAQAGRVEIKSAKIPTRDGALLAELQPTPKIIAQLRGWFPDALLVGWKYELEGDRTVAVRKAGQQLTENRTDACVINGRAYGDGYGLVTRDAGLVHLPDRTALFDALEGSLEPK